MASREQLTAEDILDALPVPWHPGVVSLTLHFYVWENADGRPRLGLFGPRPKRNRQHAALILHAIEALRRELEDVT